MRGETNAAGFPIPWRARFKYPGAKKSDPKRLVVALFFIIASQGMALWWEESIEAEFASAEALSVLLPYMAKIEGEDRRNDKYDPITATVITFLTSPLQLTLTEVGAAIFQGHSTLVYPFNLMTERQKDFVRGALGRREEWNVYHDAVVFRRSKSTLLLSPTSVLTALCGKVLESAVHPDRSRRVALCNIILQRVQGYVRIDKPVQRELNDWLVARGAAVSSCFPCVEQASPVSPAGAAKAAEAVGA